MALGAPGTHSQRTEKVKGCLWAFSQVRVYPPAPGLKLLYTRHCTELSLSWSALFTPPILKGPQSHHGVGGKHGSDPTHLWPGPWLGFCLHVCTPRLHCLGGEWCVTPSHCSPDSALPGRLLSAQPNSWPKAGLPQFSSWEESPSCNQPTPSPSHLWEQLENGSSPCATHTQAQAPD